ncbi:hypothetical protein D3C73_720100 [compost metagenome]
MTLMDKPTNNHLEQTVLLLTLTPKGVSQLETNARFAPFIQRNEDGSALAEVPIATEDLHFYVDQIWQLGKEAVIRGPHEAITCIKQKIDSMRGLYYDPKERSFATE